MTWRACCGLALLGALGWGCGDEPEVAQPTEANRVITLGPNITEIVFALGQGRRVVAVSSFCDYPPEVNSLERVGGYTNPDLEKIVRLAPDLILLAGYHARVADFAKKNRTAVVQLQIEDLASVDAAIATVGEALQCSESATALRARIRSELEAVQSAVSGLSRPRVLIITSRQSHQLDNLYTAGGSSFVSELVELAGGENIYKEADPAYFEASKETVVLRAPEVILEFHPGEMLTEEEKARYVADWAHLPSLPAVQNGRIYLITESHALRPGPRVAELARVMAAALHPSVEAPKP